MFKNNIYKITFIPSVLLTTLICTYIPANTFQPGQAFKELSPLELKELTFVISAENPEYSSLVIEVDFYEPSINTAFKFNVYYSRTKGYALYVRDQMDGTPIFILAEENALLYDPSKEELLLFKNIQLIFELEMRGDELRFVSAFRDNQEGSQQEKTNTVKIDLVSVFKKLLFNLKSKKIENNRYIFSGETKHGSTCVAQIDPSAIIPFLKIGFFSKGETIPLLSFSRLEANRNIDSSIFMLPLKDLIERGLVIKSAAIDQMQLVDLMSMMGRVLFVRSAIVFIETRKDLVQLGIVDSDWPAIEKRDKTASQALKEAFGAK